MGSQGWKLMKPNRQDDFARIRERLKPFYKRHEIDLWLRTPHPLLGGRPACEVIEEGNAAMVERAIACLEDSAYL